MSGWGHFSTTPPPRPVTRPGLTELQDGVVDLLIAFLIGVAAGFLFPLVVIILWWVA